MTTAVAKCRLKQRTFAKLYLPNYNQVDLEVRCGQQRHCAALLLENFKGHKNPLTARPIQICDGFERDGRTNAS